VYYLLGVRTNIDYFRRTVAVVHLKVALRFFIAGVLAARISKVLFFSQHSIVAKLLRNRISYSRAFLVNRWPAGIIGNWHTKVRVPFINYKSTASYKLTKTEHNRYFKFFSGFKCLLDKPDLVVFLEYPGSIGLKDCWLNGVPTISVVDSNSNSLYVTYVLPGHPNGLVQCIILSLFLELLEFLILASFIPFFVFYYFIFCMATRLLQRREHRKLNRVRSIIWKSFLKNQGNDQFKGVFGITHHRRLLKQQKSSWFCAKWISLVFAQFAVLPNNVYFLRCAQISSVIKTYFRQHKRVQELKAFYGFILGKALNSFVLGCNSIYQKQSFFKHIYFINSFKKVLSLRRSLVSLLESRLSSVIWRSFFSASVISAHKLVVFGSVKVSGLFVTKPSFLLKPGNLVVLVNLCWFVAQFNQHFEEWNKLCFRIPLPHLEVSFALRSVIFLYKPFDVELRFPFSPKIILVRSFYFQ
jgi:ribosomal protein S2